MSVGRKMTEDDKRRLRAAAVRYCKKWRLNIPGVDPLDIACGASTCASTPEEARDMRADWKRRVRYALQGYTTWGHGYVGDYVD